MKIEAAFGRLFYFSSSWQEMMSLFFISSISSLYSEAGSSIPHSMQETLALAHLPHMTAGPPQNLQGR